MDYKIAICDDSAPDREYLSNLVKHWAKNCCHQVQISLFTSAEHFLFSYEEEKDFDILLLDIEMGDMDGVTMAKKLRQENHAIQIIFITGYSDYIAEGYEVAALDFLMKPVREEKLWEVLSRAGEKLAKNEKMLYLEISGEMVCIPIYQIRYALVSGNYVTLYASKDYTVKMTLGHLEKELDERFYRLGRSALVNLTKIRRVTKTQVMLEDGTLLPLPRGAYEGVNQAIIHMR